MCVEVCTCVLAKFIEYVLSMVDGSICFQLVINPQFPFSEVYTLIVRIIILLRLSKGNNAAGARPSKKSIDYVGFRGKKQIITHLKSNDDLNNNNNK